MLKTRPLLWLATLLLAGAAAAAPAVRPAVPPPVDLQSDARLRARVTLAEADRPLGELLADLGQRVNVRLTARRDTADDKATLFLADRTAADALAMLARHLDFRWYRAGDGYLLAQSPEAAQQESALRNREWQAVQKWMEYLRGLSRTPSDQLYARQKEVAAALGRGDLAPEARAALLREEAALRDVLRHTRAVPVALEMYHRLTPLQLRQLQTTGSLRLSSAHGGIAPQLVEQAIAAMPTHGRAPDKPLYVDMVFRMTEGARDYQAGGARMARQLRMDAYLTVGSEGGSSMVNMSPRSLVDVPLPALRTAPAGDVPALARELKLDWPKPQLPAASATVVHDRLAEWTPGHCHWGSWPGSSTPPQAWVSSPTASSARACDPPMWPARPPRARFWTGRRRSSATPGGWRGVRSSFEAAPTTTTVPRRYRSGS